MNPRLTLFATIGLAAFAPCVAIADDIPVPAVLPPSGAHANLPLLDAEQLDQLVGPVALHPDALIALILPAATAPSDIVLAARYLSAGGLVAKVDDQPWDDSVKSLARYPDIVQWMDENLAWTKQLGEVFDAQPADVMKAIQCMRAKARSLGHLQDTPQQRVEVVDGAIRIVPVQREVIYVPYYDPAVVYVEYRNFGNPFLTFSSGFVAGYWLAYDFDWHVNTIWVINRHDRERCWRDRRDWHDWHPVVHVDRPRYSPPNDCHEWRPSDHNRRPDRPRRPDSVVVAPGGNTRGPFVNVAVTNVSVGAPRRDDHRRPDGDRPGVDQRPGYRNDPRRPSSDTAHNPRTPANDNRSRDRAPANTVTVAPEPTAAQPNTVSAQPPTNQASRPRYTPHSPAQPTQADRPSNPATVPNFTNDRRDRPTQPVANQNTRPTYNPANTPPAQPTNVSRPPRQDQPVRTYTPQPQPTATRETPAAQPTRTYAPPHRETSERTYTPKSTPSYSPPAQDRAPASTPAPSSAPAPSAPAPASRSNTSENQHRDAD